MRRTLTSLHHALNGLRYALKTERNLRLFVVVYLGILVLGIFAMLTAAQWLVLLFSGCIFISVELLNTALERLVDAFDEHKRPGETSFHPSLKATKDIASAASLVSFILVIIVIVLVFSGPVLTFCGIITK